MKMGIFLHKVGSVPLHTSLHLSLFLIDVSCHRKKDKLILSQGNFRGMLLIFGLLDLHALRTQIKFNCKTSSKMSHDGTSFF